MKFVEVVLSKSKEAKLWFFMNFVVFLNCPNLDFGQLWMANIWILTKSWEAKFWISWNGSLCIQVWRIVLQIQFTYFLELLNVWLVITYFCIPTFNIQIQWLYQYLVDFLKMKIEQRHKINVKVDVSTSNELFKVPIHNCVNHTISKTLSLFLQFDKISFISVKLPCDKIYFFSIHSSSSIFWKLTDKTKTLIRYT